MRKSQDAHPQRTLPVSIEEVHRRIAPLEAEAAARAEAAQKVGSGCHEGLPLYSFAKMRSRRAGGLLPPLRPGLSASREGAANVSPTPRPERLSPSPPLPSWPP